MPMYYYDEGEEDDADEDQDQDDEVGAGAQSQALQLQAVEPVRLQNQPAAATGAKPQLASTETACIFGGADDPVGTNIVCPLLSAAQEQPLIVGAALLLALGAMLPSLRARFGGSTKASSRGRPHALRQRRPPPGSRQRSVRRARDLSEDEDEEDGEEEEAYYP